jgi:hypothetical protein
MFKVGDMVRLRCNSRHPNLKTPMVDALCCITKLQGEEPRPDQTFLRQVYADGSYRGSFALEELLWTTEDLQLACDESAQRAREGMLAIEVEKGHVVQRRADFVAELAHTHGTTPTGVIAIYDALVAYDGLLD